MYYSFSMNKGFLLIVEDKADLRELLCDIFLPHVAQVETAQNGEEAIYKMANNPYINCLVAEIKLPKVNGMELLKFTWQQKVVTPFVMLTAFSTEENKKAAYDHGVFGFIEKPFRVEELISVVQQAIEINLRTRGHENFTDLINQSNPFVSHYAQILQDKKRA